MTRLAKLTANISRVHDADPIGYLVLDSNDDEAIAFTQVGVSLVYSGFWKVAGMVSLPEDGGIIHWGTSGDPDDYIASAPFQPAPATAAQITALGSTASVTLLNIVDGLTINPYQNATWRPIISLPGVALTDYQSLEFILKGGPKVLDSNAILIVDNDTGATLLNGASTTAGYASLTATTTTSFTLVVHQVATEQIRAGNYQWWLRGLKTVPEPDEQDYIATGDFIVEPYTE